MQVFVQVGRSCAGVVSMTFSRSCDATLRFLGKLHRTFTSLDFSIERRHVLTNTKPYSLAKYQYQADCDS